MLCMLPMAEIQQEIHQTVYLIIRQLILLMKPSRQRVMFLSAMLLLIQLEFRFKIHYKKAGKFSFYFFNEINSKCQKLL